MKTLREIVVEVDDVLKEVEGVVQEAEGVVGVAMEIFMVIPKKVKLVEPSGLHKYPILIQDRVKIGAPVHWRTRSHVYYFKKISVQGFQIFFLLTAYIFCF